MKKAKSKKQKARPDPRIISHDPILPYIRCLTLLKAVINSENSTGELDVATLSKVLTQSIDIGKLTKWLSTTFRVEWCF